jgi:hypothetical protein
VTGEGHFYYDSFRLPKFKYQYRTRTTSKSTSCTHNTPSDNKVANPYLPCAFVRFHSSVAAGFLTAPSQNPECSPRHTFLRFLYVRTDFKKSAQAHSFVPRSFDAPSFSSELFPEKPDRLVVLALRVREEIRDPRAVVPFVLVPRCCYRSGGRLRELEEEEKVMNHPSSIVCAGCRHGARGTANDFIFWDVIIIGQPRMLTF